MSKELLLKEINENDPTINLFLKIKLITLEKFISLSFNKFSLDYYFYLDLYFQSLSNPEMFNKVFI